MDLIFVSQKKIIHKNFTIYLNIKGERISLCFSSFIFNKFLIENRAVFLLALIITIAVMVTRDNDDDDSPNESTNNRPARLINPNEFFQLMQTFDGPINGNMIEFVLNFF